MAAFRIDNQPSTQEFFRDRVSNGDWPALIHWSLGRNHVTYELTHDGTYAMSARVDPPGGHGLPRCSATVFMKPDAVAAELL